ncbi:hypothetical protein GCM10023081_34730 [Arthrobacter ginkgonis]|uniref:Uncharacterized protein n=1 Tax=Arthrobacter ginkgonis TaxID=1630594 RepID=A0ABP7CQG3_9MICC
MPRTVLVPAGFGLGSVNVFNGEDSHGAKPTGRGARTERQRGAGAREALPGEGPAPSASEARAPGRREATPARGYW